MSETKTFIETTLSEFSEIGDDHKYDCLIVVGGDLNGTLYEIIKSNMSLGRSEENDIVLDYGGISRIHMNISAEGGRVQIADMDSINGTYLNDNKLNKKVTIRHGDLIKIGHITLKFLAHNSPDIKIHHQLIEQATKDGLTGCFNKKYFFETLERELKNSLKGNEPLALIVLDIDHFKRLNDTKGHDAGDYVLKEMARIIRNDHTRRRDVLARYGGEEFVVIMLNADPQTSYDWAEKVRKSIELHDFSYDKDLLKITISVGIADYIPSSPISANELFIKADAALYEAKESGRNRVCVHSPDKSSKK